MRRAEAQVIQGNCEESLGEEAEDCGCGFAQGGTCDRLSAQWFAHASAALDTDAKAWMKTLPKRLTFSLGGRRLAVVHGAPSRINAYVFASTPAADKLREIEDTGCDGVICGHSGLPFSQIIEGRLWHNAGVIGLPANDGMPRVWYSLLAPESGGLRLEHHALDYDHHAAAIIMRRAALPEEYASALESGLWDNCEILPGPETEARGKALEEHTLFWPGSARIDGRAAAE